MATDIKFKLGIIIGKMLPTCAHWPAFCDHKPLGRIIHKGFEEPFLRVRAIYVQLVLLYTVMANPNETSKWKPDTAFQLVNIDHYKQMLMWYFIVGRTCLEVICQHNIRNVHAFTHYWNGTN